MDSPMAAALRAFSPKKKEKPTIKVCGCGSPLIWTFFIPYCEYYCLNCGNAGGMFGTGDDKVLTKELRLKSELVNAIFKVLRKRILPSGTFGRSGCKKDNREGRYSSSCDDHGAHLTKSEVEWNEIARKYLEKYKGVLNDK